MNAKHFSAVIGEDGMIRPLKGMELEAGDVSVVLLPDSALREEFDELATTWKDETQFLSSVTDIVMHPAYQRIIGLGPDVVPLILEDLEDETRHWFWALWAITGENPVPPEDRGHVEEMKQHWLCWGRENGWHHSEH